MKAEPDCIVACPIISSYYCKFLLDTGEAEKALDRARLTLQWRESKSWQVAFDTTSLYGSDLLFLGLSYLELGDLENAAKYLNEQEQLFKSANEWLYLPTGLIGMSRLHIARGELLLAEEKLREALSIARSTGALLSVWEANIALAELALESGDSRLAYSCLQQAMDVKGMDAYVTSSSRMKVLKDQLQPYFA